MRRLAGTLSRSRAHLAVVPLPPSLYACIRKEQSHAANAQTTTKKAGTGATRRVPFVAFPSPCLTAFLEPGTLSRRNHPPSCLTLSLVFYRDGRLFPPHITTLFTTFSSTTSSTGSRPCHNLTLPLPSSCPTLALSPSHSSSVSAHRLDGFSVDLGFIFGIRYVLLEKRAG